MSSSHVGRIVTFKLVETTLVVVANRNIFKLPSHCIVYTEKAGYEGGSLVNFNVKNVVEGISYLGSEMLTWR